MNIFSAFLLVTTLSSSDDDLQLGKEIYTQHCKVCHGVQGTTNPFAAQVLNPIPRDFTSQQSKKELNKERMVSSAIDGRPGTAMMPWKNVLSLDEIRSVILYIRTQLMGL